MSDVECRHGDVPADCAICREDSRSASKPQVDLVGEEKLLVFCPRITDDSLLHFSRRGDSYRLRAYVGRLAGRREWFQPDAPKSGDFWRTYAPEARVDVAPEGLSVDQHARWAALIATYNQRFGIGAQPSS